MDGPEMYRENDGTTYWQDVAGEWMGAPTYEDGSVDYAQAGYVADFDLEDDERYKLIAGLVSESQT
jgi:hypothetical protein